MEFLTDDLIDFAKYEQETDEHARVKPASVWVAELIDNRVDPALDPQRVVPGETGERVGTLGAVRGRRTIGHGGGGHCGLPFRDGQYLIDIVDSDVSPVGGAGRRAP